MQLTSLSLALSRIAGGGFSPLSLFAAGEQGAWYQPSDLSTLYQDSAGTIPVTAVEQRVGKMLDKSGRGNHAFQATTTPNDKRPILSARVNLLTKTEDFSDAAWARFNCVAVANVTTSPIGTLTGNTITNNSGGSTWVRARNSSTAVIGVSYKTICYFKAGSANYSALVITDTTDKRAIFNLINGTVNVLDSGITATITSAGNGWFACSVTLTSSATSTIYTSIGPASTGSYNSNNTDYVYAWGADLRPANIGNNIPAYQRVNTATDYDTAGFPYYLKADGTYTSMSTNSIDFSATDKMTVVNGVRVIASSTYYNAITELNAGLTNTFSMGTNSSSQLVCSSVGTISQTIFDTTPGFPLSFVGTEIANISAPIITLRRNGIQTATSSASQGTGNYGNYPLYLFARTNSSLFFNGQFYGAIIRGATTSGNDLLSTESYINNQSGGLY